MTKLEEIRKRDDAWAEPGHPVRGSNASQAACDRRELLLMIDELVAALAVFNDRALRVLK